MKAADLSQLLRQRRSLRRYHADAVPDDYIEQILEAAIWAPSAHNRQPWRFAVIREEETKARLARAMGAKLRSDLSADNVPQRVIDADVDRSYQRISAAPLLILLCMSLRDMDVYGDGRRDAHERTMAQQSAAMAGQISCSWPPAWVWALAGCARRSSVRVWSRRCWTCRRIGSRKA